MIVVDTSALVAIVLDEALATACQIALRDASRALISAGTMVEVLVVASRKNVTSQMNLLLEALSPDVIPVTERSARQAGEAYARWGKGLHPAGLNFGDCFAYALAQERSCPLLYIGDDFSKTDVRGVL